MNYTCPTCDASNQIVNQCGCDPNNLPTVPCPPDVPRAGDYILYYGHFESIVGGFIAERMISPLTGNPRYRVVDSMQDAKDDGAGRWIGLENTVSVNALPVNDGKEVQP